MSELQAFVGCLRADADPPVSTADARATVDVAVAATRSIREGAPIEVSLESRQHAGAGREPPRSRKGFRGNTMSCDVPTAFDH